MPVTVKINGTCLSSVHKFSNGVSMATVPDVCKTPTPGGPVPIPYPNIAQSATLADGTTTVKVDSAMAAVKGSKFAMSNGDQAGTVGGVKSGVFMKEATWIMYSFDVKMNGKNACRLTDPMFHNAENTVNMSGVSQLTVDVFVNAGEITKCPCCNGSLHDNQKDPETGKAYKPLTGEEWYKNRLQEATRDDRRLVKNIERNKGFASKAGKSSEEQAVFDRAIEEKQNNIKQFEDLFAQANPETSTCPNVHGPEDKCGIHFEKTSPSPNTSDTRWRESVGYDYDFRMEVRRRHGAPEDAEIAHKTPLSAGGCPTGGGNVVPLTEEECMKIDAAQSKLQKYIKLKKKK